MKVVPTALFTVGLISAGAAFAAPLPTELTAGCSLKDETSCDVITTSSHHAEPAPSSEQEKAEMAKVIQLFDEIESLLDGNHTEAL